MTKKSEAGSGALLRGPKLIKKAIEKGREEALAEPEPVAAAVLKKLTLPNGESISPSMKELLKVDALWLGMEFDDEEGDIESVTLEEAVEDTFGEDAPALFAEACELFDGDAILIGGASESLRVLYVGEADESGEYAVLTLTKEPEPWVELVPFDVWVGQELGALPAGTRGAAAPGYEAAAKELAEATGDGRASFAPTAGERGEESDEEDEDEDEDEDDAEEGDASDDEGDGENDNDADDLDEEEEEEASSAE